MSLPNEYQRDGQGMFRASPDLVICYSYLAKTKILHILFLSSVS